MAACTEVVGQNDPCTSPRQHLKESKRDSASAIGHGLLAAANVEQSLITQGPVLTCARSTMFLENPDRVQAAPSDKARWKTDLPPMRRESHSWKPGSQSHEETASPGQICQIHGVPICPLRTGLRSDCETAIAVLAASSCTLNQGQRDTFCRLVQEIRIVIERKR